MITYQDLASLIAPTHLANTKWWRDLDTGEPLLRNKQELLMLVVSEIAEAMEGERKDSMDDKLPRRKAAEVEMADALIRLFDYLGGFGMDLSMDGFLAGTMMLPTSSNLGERLMRIVRAISSASISALESRGESVAISQVLGLVVKYCQTRDFDLLGAYHEKMAYNAIREDHMAANRREPGGKKW